MIRLTASRYGKSAFPEYYPGSAAGEFRPSLPALLFMGSYSHCLSFSNSQPTEDEARRWRVSAIPATASIDRLAQKSQIQDIPSGITDFGRLSLLQRVEQLISIHSLMYIDISGATYYLPFLFIIFKIKVGFSNVYFLFNRRFRLIRFLILRLG